ncbi:hypothetical protein CDD80_4174 [Ophiocordyceps camponoti-rufipedis]|uniref:Uncharacterized protein n=1 Tax=Ophiocordyceps camponoti-rufipedis TaxID=2004952 RepID=A0A2C5Y4B5_9HYPO|nr:hypothetical protein CDD80_4174 [Ophiocordyceps camponoti-rufipedis]
MADPESWSTSRDDPEPWSISMDDPEAFPWPFWKFGMRQNDLAALKKRYNSITLPLQDPVAFQHDVCEISHVADTPDQFHRLMESRRQQRVDELDQYLLAVACQIVGNPKLMADDQWPYAVQVFRTRSYDSILRYFGNYVPDSCSSSTPDSPVSDADSVHTLSTKASTSDHLHSSLSLHDDACPDGISDAMSSSAVSSDDDSRGFSSYSPSDSSLSGSSHAHIFMSSHFDQRGDDEACQEDEGEVGVSDCGLAEAQSAHDEDFCLPSQSCSYPLSQDDFIDDDGDFLRARIAQDHSDSRGTITSVDTTPTPHDSAACCYLDYKRRASRRSPSPRTSCHRVDSSARNIMNVPVWHIDVIV